MNRFDAYAICFPFIKMKILGVEILYGIKFLSLFYFHTSRANVQFISTNSD